MTRKVLLIEDDDVLRTSLTQSLELEGLDVIPTNGFVQARRHFRANFPGIIVSDIRMPHQDGFDVLASVRSADEEIPVVLLTGHSDVPTAMRALKEGAFDYLEKPIAPDQLMDIVERALKHRELVLKSRKAERALLRSDEAAANFPGHGPVSTSLRDALRQVADQPKNIFLSGQIGAGKRRAAYAISVMASEPRTYVGFNAETDNLTCFPDLSDSKNPIDLGLKNAHAISHEHAHTLEHWRNELPDLRVIATSLKPLSSLIGLPVVGEVMEWLAPIEIQVPSLRERREDLPEIFDALLRQSARSLNADMPIVPDAFLTELITRDWEGNLAELQQVATSIALGQEVYASSSPNLTLAQQMDTFERVVLIETLKRAGGRAQLAANLLGLPRNTLYDRLARHELSPKDFRRE